MRKALAALTILMCFAGSLAFADRKPALFCVPFENRGAIDFAWIRDGLADAVSADLERVSGLTVFRNEDVNIALNEMPAGFAPKLNPDPILRIGSFLKADVLIKGDYLVTGDRVELTALLADVRTGATLKTIKLSTTLAQVSAWPETALFALVKELAGLKMAGVKKPVLSAAEKASIEAHGRRTPAAFEAYARGLALEQVDAGAAEVFFEKAAGLAPDFAAPLTHLGLLKKAAGGASDRAIASLEKAALALERRRDDKTIEYAAVLRYLGNLYGEIGNEAKALAVYDKAGAIRLALGCAESPADLYAAETVSLIYKRSARPAPALEYCRRAIALRERLGWDKTAGYARLLERSGGLARDNGKPDDGLAYYLRSKKSYEALGLAKSVDYVNLLIDFGYFYSDKTDFAKALPYFTSAGDLAQRVSGAHSVEYAEAMRGLGLAYYKKGDLGAGRDCFLKAKATDDALKLTESEAYGVLLIYIAATYPAGEPDRKLEWLAQARAVLEKIKDTDSIAYASLLENQGGAYADKENYDAALSSYLGARKIYERRGMGNTQTYANLLTNMGTAFWKKADLPHALEYDNQAAALQERLGLRKTVLYAQTMLNLGVLHEHKGEIDAALAYYDNARIACEASGQVQTTTYALILAGSGNGWVKKKEFRKALDQYARARSILEHLGLNKDVRYADLVYAVALTCEDASDKAAAGKSFRQAAAAYAAAGVKGGRQDEAAAKAKSLGY